MNTVDGDGDNGADDEVNDDNVREPTSEPTNEPTSSPTEPVSFQHEKKSDTSKGVQMEITLEFTRRVLQAGPSEEAPPPQSTAQCIRLWEAKIVEEIESEANDNVPNIETLNVFVYNITQELEIETSILTLVYDVDVEIRSPSHNYNVDDLIEGPFDTESDQEEFVRFLRSTNCSVFSYASAVKVVLQSNGQAVAPVEGDGDMSSNSDKATTGLVVGVVFAGLALIAVVGLYVVARRKQHQQKGQYPGKSPPSSPLAELDAQEDGFMSQIGMRTYPGDISTLSDPMPALNATANPKDETSTIGSFSFDYDYQKAYQGSVSDVQSLDDEERLYISADDETLQKHLSSEEPIYVSAPAGTLGLILESSEDGVPVVSGIRSNSVLAGDIKLGDRLLSVDGQDVTVLLTSEVSKLIASKKHQPIRRMVFVRPQTQSK